MSNPTFKKVYSGPGYPLDPKAQKKRMIESCLLFDRATKLGPMISDFYSEEYKRLLNFALNQNWQVRMGIL